MRLYGRVNLRFEVVWQWALPGPAHELFGSRKLRLAPQDYSPWTPPSDRFLVRSYPPASRHELEQPSRSARWTCRESCTRQSWTWSLRVGRTCRRRQESWLRPPPADAG